MAMPGYPRAFATVGSCYPRHSPISLHPLKVDLSGFVHRRSGNKGIKPKWRTMAHENDRIHSISEQDVESSADYERSPRSLSQESFILSSMKMNFLERLILAWRIIFPSSTSKSNSNAMIAKQRLKMILLSDRCAVNDETKQKIVDSMLSSLSDFVEIDSEDKVQFNVSTDSDLRTIYSVTVPVRRVKADYQGSEEVGATINTELKDDGERSGPAGPIFDSLIAEGKG
ncbi:cell division topological specificity factor homolog, chloroplastic-like isoform X2 [Cucurbita maxima]|uniref:Cell division topological specificity factor homolog, chloroplastic-like isoform X2 n=1 Tax=Cucurbita maxima TaxID=3661 RepID=A0A6J1K368_CUCMA|nr:cell division topological specificity factor homolog, chloroplastic-like isoform X2 [Cucurbita maxima]